MSQAQSGDTVRVHYTGKLEDGSVFDSSLNREPLEFQLGQGRVIAGFEQAVVGLAPGESKVVEVPAAEGYGERREEMVVSVNRQDLPPEISPKLGQQLQITQPDGSPVPVRVVEVSNEAVKLDANHPLAGKNLTFELELLEIV